MSEHQADIFPRPSHYIMFVVLGCAGFVCLSLISVIRMNQPDGSFQNTELSTNLPIFIVPISGLLVAAFGSRRAVETPRKTAVFRFAAIGSPCFSLSAILIIILHWSTLPFATEVPALGHIWSLDQVFDGYDHFDVCLGRFQHF